MEFVMNSSVSGASTVKGVRAEINFVSSDSKLSRSLSLNLSAAHFIATS